MWEMVVLLCFRPHVALCLHRSCLTYIDWTSSASFLFLAVNVNNPVSFSEGSSA